ncbi:MAG: hypothetical protein EPO36_07555 [Chloroflexota bacterium]|nr:MAG: hypothetical protein EPO36_07555 [Chloroflexota bacterium]
MIVKTSPRQGRFVRGRSARRGSAEPHRSAGRFHWHGHSSSTGAATGRGRMPVMTAPVTVSSPSALRLMPFGQARAHDIRDPLWEPLWGGQRVLVHALDGRVAFRDEHGEAVAGHDDLRAAIAGLTMAEEAVIDGYLVPAPLRDTTGAELPAGLDAVQSAAEMGRQFLLGNRNTEKREEEIRPAEPPVQVPSSSPAAFIAVDLLWLDEDPIIDVPLLERKRLLESVLGDGEIVRRTMSVRSPVEQWYAQWRALGFNAVAAKGANSRYTPGQPNGEWATALIPKR